MAEAPAQLKDWFNEARYRWFADEVGRLSPGFDRKAFLRHVLEGLGERELLQRLRRTTEGLHLCLPGGYAEHLSLLRELAPRIGHGFVGILPCDYVGCHGLHDFDTSMAALAEFTRFGSGEFAVREFLRADQDRALRQMLAWAQSPDEHVRRLASEGSRPRLPWSFRLERLVRDPSPTRPILEALRADPSLYVRKSVANHLNDISKDHPDFMLALLEGWDLSHPHTAWIARHACRSLIKAGHARALALFKVGTRPRLERASLSLSPRRLAIGGTLALSAMLKTGGRSTQRLVVDFAVHYVKQSGRPSRKVFKWKMLELEAGAELSLSKRMALVQRSTRTLAPGLHRVELLVNGQSVDTREFTLTSR